MAGGGSNSLYGGQGDDTLIGSDSNDILSGDRGNNWLTGGVGEDTFLFSGHGNTAMTSDQIGNDTITDFMSGQDKIALDRRVYTALGDSLAASDFTAVELNDGASNAKLIYEQSSGQLFYNPTTEIGDESTIARLDTLPDLTINDFELL
jgi:Ca2+-binding RTX toxin-like protein